MKRCTTCEVTKPSSMFKKDGKKCASCRQVNHEWYLRNKSKCVATAIKWNKDHPEEARQSIANWTAVNQSRIIRSRRKRLKQRRKEDPGFRIRENLRCRLRDALSRQNVGKSVGAITLLGCSIDSFKRYIETGFKPGMSWANKPEVWVLDHIIPCALFDLTNLEHQRACFHFSNYQPMFTELNRKKSDKLPDGRCARFVRRELQ